MVEEKKSNNNAIWIVLGIVLFICCCTVAGVVAVGSLGVAGIATGMQAVMEEIQKSEVYADPVARAKANAEVVSALGEPITDSLNLLSDDSSMNFNENANTGDAAFSVALTGPNGTGILRVEAKMVDGAWSYTTLTVQLSNGTTVDLLNE